MNLSKHLLSLLLGLLLGYLISISIINTFFYDNIQLVINLELESILNNMDDELDSNTEDITQVEMPPLMYPDTIEEGDYDPWGDLAETPIIREGL